MNMDTNWRQQVIERIRALPARLETLTHGLTDAQLTAAFEPGEWTVAQNLHHVFDVHATFYTRCKQIVFEETPPLVNMDENGWAALPDAREANLAPALAGIAYVQHRLAVFLENLDATAWQREGMHTERGDHSRVRRRICRHARRDAHRPDSQDAHGGGHRWQIKGHTLPARLLHLLHLSCMIGMCRGLHRSRRMPIEGESQYVVVGVA